VLIFSPKSSIFNYQKCIFMYYTLEAFQKLLEGFITRGS
jgi:hypothetical protein